MISRAWVVAIAVASVACRERAERHEQRSALLVTLDTTRPDALSCYGAAPGSTPTLEALARESVVYERAYTTAPITLTAHASMLTGLVPPRHGLRDNGIAALSPAARTLAEAAHEEGIETAAFVGAVVLDRSLGLDQGFDVYDGPPAKRSAAGHPTERPARAVIDAALAWLEKRDRARPFFAWIHLYDAHHPYAPVRALPPTASEHERYLAEVSDVDAELGRLFAALRADGLLDETLVCVTADHGEAFGEHKELTHGAFCWNTTLSVPLIVRHPDGARAGERSRELVSAVDVAPTLADALGIALPDADGRSLLVRRDDDDGGAYFESYAGFLAFGWSPIAGWIDAHGKYLHASRQEFYDAADAGEERDLAAERGAALEPYRAAIAALAARPGVGASEDALDPELRAGIQSLGYSGFDPTGGALPHPLDANERPSPHAMVGAWRESMVAQERIAQGRFDDAAELLRRLRADDPENPFLRAQLATALMRTKRHQEAFDVLAPLAEAASVQPQVLYKLGVCAAKLARRDEALAYLERAVALAPHEERYRAKLAAVRDGTTEEEDE